MKLKNYLKDKIIPILLFIITNLILLGLFLVFKMPKSLIIATIFLFLLFFLSIFCYDYFRKKSFYNHLLTNLEQLDQKYLIQELITNPNFLEGKILYQTLYEANKSMKENVKQYEHKLDEFKDYIEMWIHEVKLPLSTITLRSHRQKNNIDKVIQQQIKRIDNEVEQILYYARSEIAEQDYLIKECSLNEIIKSVILNNKDLILEKEIELKIDKINMKVLTDSKWLEFILGQIISNSIKYKKNTSKSFLEITATTNKDETKLSIYDNGIGINSTDLKRVFQKSFTGKNGRQNQNSTGMGLYIAKKLCQKLGHQIEITSNLGEYTKVTITFYKNHYYDVLK